jgi:predicted ArsR family transcriptional regulator
MTKQNILKFMVRHQQVDAFDLAHGVGVPYPTAAMALLRLTRQGLAQRFVDPVRRIFWYRLTERGLERLHYLSD